MTAYRPTTAIAALSLIGILSACTPSGRETENTQVSETAADPTIETATTAPAPPPPSRSNRRPAPLQVGGPGQRACSLRSRKRAMRATCACD